MEDDDLTSIMPLLLSSAMQGPQITEQQAFAQLLAKDPPVMDPRFDPGPFGQANQFLIPLAAAMQGAPLLAQQQQQQNTLQALKVMSMLSTMKAAGPKARKAEAEAKLAEAEARGLEALGTGGPQGLGPGETLKLGNRTFRGQANKTTLKPIGGEWVPLTIDPQGNVTKGASVGAAPPSMAQALQGFGQQIVQGPDGQMYTVPGLSRARADKLQSTVDSIDATIPLIKDVMSIASGPHGDKAFGAAAQIGMYLKGGKDQVRALRDIFFNMSVANGDDPIVTEMFQEPDKGYTAASDAELVTNLINYSWARSQAEEKGPLSENDLSRVSVLNKGMFESRTSAYAKMKKALQLLTAKRNVIVPKIGKLKNDFAPAASSPQTGSTQPRTGISPAPGQERDPFVDMMWDELKNRYPTETDDQTTKRMSQIFGKGE
jgi:hypothetical protein